MIGENHAVEQPSNLARISLVRGKMFPLFIVVKLCEACLDAQWVL